MFKPKNEKQNEDVSNLIQLVGQTHRKILSKQQSSPPAIRVGPISLNSNVLKPFSPVPTNAITNPMAVVPSPT